MSLEGPFKKIFTFFLKKPLDLHAAGRIIIRVQKGVCAGSVQDV